MNSTEIDLLHYLDKLTIEFGILDSEGNLILNVDLMDADNNITTYPMKVRDIMYFTEYGTISIPGRFILEKSLQNIRVPTRLTHFSILLEMPTRMTLRCCSEQYYLRKKAARR